MTKIVPAQPPNRARDTCLQQIRTALQPTVRGSATPAAERDRLVLIFDRLGQVEASIEQTAQAWEQREYWAKADTFRRTWSWVAPTRAALLQSLREDSLSSADTTLADLLVRLIQLGVRQPSASASASRQKTGTKRSSDPGTLDT